MVDNDRSQEVNDISGSKGANSINSPVDFPRISGRLVLPDGHIYYEISGQGSPLVLIHSAITDMRSWDREFKAFAREWTLIRYDVRGLGKSTPASNEYSDSDDLRTLLAHLKIPRVSIIAASNSGRIALDLALRFPELMDRIVLLSSGLGMFDIESVPELGDSISDFENRFGEITKLWEQGSTEESIDNLMELFAAKQPTETRSLVRTMLRENLREIITDESAKYAHYEISEGNLRKINVPVMVIVGNQDHEIIRWSSAHLAKHIKNSKFVIINGADHLVNLSSPDAFDKESLEFLREGLTRQNPR